MLKTQGSLALVTHTVALPELLDQAAARLEHARSFAEIMEVVSLADRAYDEAKRAARVAEMMEAHEQVRTVSNDLTGKMLQILHRADCRLADEYDAAQARGEVVGSKGGGSGSNQFASVPKRNGSATAADLKLTRKRVHDARKHRDAEAVNPGLVDRMIQEKIASGEEPTKTEVNSVVANAVKTAPKIEARPIASIVLTEWKILSAAERKVRLNVESDTKLLKQTGVGIEWAQWSWNPITGCLHECPYCYARDITERYQKAFPHGFAPLLWPERLAAPRLTKVPKQAAEDTRFRNVFTCSMADLFGRWVPREWIEMILEEMRVCKQWNFLCSTKFPKRMAEFDIPSNVWMGTTVDLQARVANAEAAFAKVNSKVRWLSIEPMIEPITFKQLERFHWVVIGGASASRETPEWRPPFPWIADLVGQARAAGAAVYMKTNLGIANRILEMPFDAPIKCDPQTAPAVFHYLGKGKRAEIEVAA